jgi:hypothetical protein
MPVYTYTTIDDPSAVTGSTVAGVLTTRIRLLEIIRTRAAFTATSSAAASLPPSTTL